MKLVWVWIGVCIILTACQINIENKQAATTKPAVSPTLTVSPTSTEPTEPKPTPAFPSSVDLVFKPLQTELLKEEQPSTKWTLVKEIPFGEIKQQKVGLDIYRTPDIHAMIRFHNTYYSIPDELMEIPTLERSSMYVLNHTFSDSFLLLGGIELFADGPGLMAYIGYDSGKDRWFVFEKWGKPQLVDLDSDGENEFVIQFEGLHLSFPDLTIYTLRNGAVEESESVRSAVMGSSGAGYAKLGSDKQITVGTLQGDAQARYVYEKGKLLKQ